MNASVIILPPSELDPSTCDVLAASLRAVDPAAEVLVDFAGVSFCDSSGLRALVIGAKRQGAGGGSICVINARPEVERVFALTGLGELLDRGVREPLPSDGAARHEAVRSVRSRPAR